MKDETQIPTINIKKYGGKQVAIVDGKVVAKGYTAQEVIGLAKKKMPKRPLSEIHIFAVPKTLHVIYYVS